MPIPLPGDRSAFDVINYPELHGNDYVAGSGVLHLPPTSGSGAFIPVWDGEQYVPQLLEEVEGALQFSGFTKITVSDTEPTSPAVGDLWVDTS